MDSMQQSGCYLSFEGQYAKEDFKTDDGRPFPDRLYFLNTSYDEKTRTFKGLIDYRKHVTDGDYFRVYELVFSEDLSETESGIKLCYNAEGVRKGCELLGKIRYFSKKNNYNEEKGQELKKEC